MTVMILLRMISQKSLLVSQTVIQSLLFHRNLGTLPILSLRIFQATAAVISVSDNTGTNGQSLESIHSEEDDSQFEENNFALLRRSTFFKKQCHLDQCQIPQSTKRLTPDIPNSAECPRSSEDKTLGSVLLFSAKSLFIIGTSI
jgi:hypothetical protein